VLSYIVPMILAVAGGLTLYAPREYFPLAVQVLGTFQSFKLLPTLLLTMIKPFGHQFKVTPKGVAAKSSSYDHEVFWTAAGLMGLTTAGIVINLSPEWRIISDGALIPIVAVWALYNILVLFVVCMMSLQGSVQRGEERFPSNEPVLMVSTTGAQIVGRLEDISLSGALLLTGEGHAWAGHTVRIFISEVGFVPAEVVRYIGSHMAVRFKLSAGLERDLLIRKLFTAGSIATTSVTASTWSVTAVLLRSIWSAPSGTHDVNPDQKDWRADTIAEAKLPAESFVVAPHPARQWAKIVAQRRTLRKS